MENSIEQKILESLLKIENSLFNSKPILNIEEVSVFTGISKSTLYKLTSTRDIPHYKKSKHLVFDRQEITEWMKSNPIPTKEDIDKAASTYLTLRHRRGI